MTETGVPYQAGEPAEAEQKALGQVLYEAVYAEQVVRDVQTAGDLVQWGDADMDPDAQRRYEAWAAAVEAEVLRRAVAHLDKQLEGLLGRHLVNRDTYGGFDWAVRVLQEYAEQQESRT